MSVLFPLCFQRLQTLLVPVDHIVIPPSLSAFAKHGYRLVCLEVAQKGRVSRSCGLGESWGVADHFNPRYLQTQD
jgi:hypothetical protein